MSCTMVYRDRFWWVIVINHQNHTVSVLAKFRHAHQARIEKDKFWALIH